MDCNVSLANPHSLLPHPPHVLPSAEGEDGGGMKVEVSWINLYTWTRNQGKTTQTTHARRHAHTHRFEEKQALLDLPCQTHLENYKSHSLPGDAACFINQEAINFCSPEGRRSRGSQENTQACVCLYVFCVSVYE